MPTLASAPRLLPAEMNEKPTEVLRVLLHPVILRLDLFLLEEPQHVLLELPRALARDDLDQRRLLRHGLVDDRRQRLVDVLATVVYVVQVKLQLHDHRPAAPEARHLRPARLPRLWPRPWPPGCHQHER